jgi:hypothetical protein
MNVIAPIVCSFTSPTDLTRWYQVVFSRYPFAFFETIQINLLAEKGGTCR